MSKRFDDPALKARLRTLLTYENPDRPFGDDEDDGTDLDDDGENELDGLAGFWDFLKVVKPTTSAHTIIPILKTPTPAERAAVKSHLLTAVAGKLMAQQPKKVTSVTGLFAKMAAGAGKAQPKKVASVTSKFARPVGRPAANPPPMPFTTEATPTPVKTKAQREQEIDVTPPPPAYDGFHGHAPGFHEAGNDFGDLESDLGLND
jgi:hypothetical protein